MKKNFFKNPNPNLNMNTNMNGNNDKYYAFPENSKIIPADSALRFSFEKMLKMKQKNQINKYQGGMNPLEEAE